MCDCDLQKGETYTIRTNGKEGGCGGCGHPLLITDHKAVFERTSGGQHIFSLSRPFMCPQCGYTSYQCGMICPNSTNLVSSFFSLLLRH